MNKNKVNSKTVIINFILILIVTILVIYFLIKNNFFESLSDLKGIFSYKYLFLIIVILIIVSSESFVIYKNFKNINKKFTYFHGVSSYLYGNLGSNITPGKSGHFPFMIYNYEKKGYSLDQSLGSITQNQLIYTTSMIIFYIIVFTISSINNFQITVNSLVIELKWFSLVGIILNLLFSILFLTLGFCKPVNKIVIILSSKILYFFKKISSKEDYIAEQTEKMKIYREQVIFFVKHFYQSIITIFVYLIVVVFYYGLPYIVYLLVLNKNFSIDELVLFFSMTQAMTYVTNIIPIPANTGVSEYAFLCVFANVIDEKSSLAICMILYRLTICYLLLIIDFIYFLVSTIITEKKRITN